MLLKNFDTTFTGPAVEVVVRTFALLVSGASKFVFIALVLYALCLGPARRTA